MDVVVLVILSVAAGLVVLCALGLFHLTVRRRGLRGPVTSADVARSHATPVGWTERAILAIALIAHASFTLPQMARGLTYDELFTASHFVVGASLWQAASSVAVFNNHVAYSLLAGVAIRLLGSAEWVLRLPAFLLGIGTVYMLWRFARTWSTAPTALLSAAILALSPFFLVWTHSARGYSGLALMTLVSSHTFLLLLTGGSPRLSLPYILATVLAAYFHLYGVWVVLVQYAVFLCVVGARMRRPPTTEAADKTLQGLRALWWSFIVAPAAVVVLYFPIATQLLSVSVVHGRTPIRTDIVAGLFQAYAAVGSPVLAAAAWLLALVGAGDLFRRRPLVAGYLVALLAVPFLVMWLVVRPLDLFPRFFTYGIPVFAYLVASGAVGICGGSAGRGWRGARALSRTAVSALVCLTGILIAVEWLPADRHPTPTGDYREWLRSPGQSAPPTFAVGGDAEMFDYYLGKPLPVLRSLPDLETAMRSARNIRVAYHDMSWNSSEEQQMATLLEQRCHTDIRGPVIVFQCGQ